MDIWQKILSGELELWVELGLSGEKIVRQSCGKDNEVIVYCYGCRTSEVWWEKIKNNTARFDNLQVTNFTKKDTSELGKKASRLMKLQVNIQDGDLMVSVDDNIVNVNPVIWKMLIIERKAYLLSSHFLNIRGQIPYGLLPYGKYGGRKWN